MVLLHFILLVLVFRSCSSQNSTSSTVILSTTTVASNSTIVSGELNSTTKNDLTTRITALTSGTASLQTTIPTMNATNVASKNVTTNATDRSPTNSTGCRASLSKSENLSPFWVTIVLSAVPISTDIGNCSWIDEMETRLVTLLATARALSSSTGKRRKRAAVSGVLSVQIVSAVRGASRSNTASNSTQVNLVFYALISGSYLTTSSLVASLTTISSSAAGVLGYALDSQPSAYEDLPSKISYLWLIGAMFGSLAGIVIIIWGVLFAYQKCLRPFDAQKRRRRSWETAIDDFYGHTGSMAHVPDMRANPKIGFSKADIGTIADEVAKHLDSHIPELVSSADAGRRRIAGVDRTDGPIIRPQSQSHVNSEAAVEELNIIPLNTCQVEQSGLTQADRRTTLETELTIDADNPAEVAPDDKKDNPAADQTESNQLDAIQQPEHLDSQLMMSRGGQQPSLSPYRTGDHLARIRPILEEDLKRQDHLKFRKLPASPTQETISPESAGPRLISVIPRSQSAFGGVGVGSGGAHKPVLVRPANQDEWDVVRELSRRPESDNRALLGTLQREIAELTYTEIPGSVKQSDSNG